MLTAVGGLWAKQQLSLDWRRWLTEKVLDRWMAQGHHYQLQLIGGEHDNPDGRIAEDIRIATESTVNLAHSLVYSLLVFGSFIDILLVLTGSAYVPGTAWLVPGYMVILAFAYAGAGTLFGLLLGRPLVKATNQLQTAEAWLKDHPNDPSLLLTLGRLCLQTSLWGKARDYLESSLRVQRNPEACAELARLLAQLGDTERSNQLFQEGLGLLDERLLALPLPEGVRA